MHEKEYFLKLDEETIIYVYLKTDSGEVIEFVVKLLTIFEDKWHEILRYDSGHDCPHKDILNIDCEIIRKVWYDFLDNSRALSMAIQDLKDNYEFYKERCSKWLKGR